MKYAVIMRFHSNPELTVKATYDSIQEYSIDIGKCHKYANRTVRKTFPDLNKYTPITILQVSHADVLDTEYLYEIDHFVNINFQCSKRKK